MLAAGAIDPGILTGLATLTAMQAVRRKNPPLGR
jgi:hypothetical protein